MVYSVWPTLFQTPYTIWMRSQYFRGPHYFKRGHVDCECESFSHADKCEPSQISPTLTPKPKHSCMFDNIWNGYATILYIYIQLLVQYKILRHPPKNVMLNITQLFGCDPWKHGSDKNNSSLITGFPIDAEHSWCVLRSYWQATII